jgi:hypothetical protein
MTNLKDAIDHAVVASAKLAGATSLRSIEFPFCGSADKYQGALTGKCKNVPSEIVALMSHFQPYEGGDDLLWSLSKVSANNRHQFIRPVVARRTLNFDSGIPFPSDDGSDTWTLTNPDGSTIKRPMPELLVEMMRGTQISISTDIHFDSSVENWGGLPVIPVIAELVCKVLNIVNAIENECRRAGLLAAMPGDKTDR